MYAMPAESRAIGVFARYVHGYYYGAMLAGIHQVARNAGIPLVIVEGPLRDRRLPAFSAEQIAGWIILHPDEDDRANLAALCTAAVPIVTVPVPLEGMPCTLVQIDNRGGMCAAVLHLVDHGHHRIAYADHGPDEWSRQRYLGYCDALAARGIALDAGLVISLDSLKPDEARLHQERGEHAARYLLERELPCTALVAATDNCAITAMRIFQAAGYRIPDDIAVVGFDDIVEAQYAIPPLTTVRSQFDVLGRTAAEQLQTQIRGDRAAGAQVISVPTTLLHRRSCGCTALVERVSGASAAHLIPTNWQTRLVQQLVEVVRYPVPLDPAVPPEQLWPGASVLVAAIDASLRGQPPRANIESAWQQAIAQTENLEALDIALSLLEDTAEQRLTATPCAMYRPAVMALLRRMRLELIRARLAHEIAPKQQLSDEARTNYAVSIALLGSSVGEAQKLEWLASTPAIWGCLGLWEDLHGPETAMLMIAGTYRCDTLLNGSLGQRMPATAFPPIERLPLSAQRGQDVTILCPIRTRMRDWGVLALCGWIDQSLMTTGTEHLAIQATLLGETLDRDTALTALTRARAAAEQANAFKSQFLSTMSHELRTPLNAILHFTRFLSKDTGGPLTEHQIDLQQRILANADHLLGVINDILDLSKIEAGRMDLSLEEADLLPILKGVLATAVSMTKGKGLSLTLESADPLPSVVIDKTRVRQVLLNLLSNAAKFTHRGGITVCAAPAGGGMICISVTDTGIGIAQEHQALVFEEFRQVQGAMDGEQGTGLGLPISKRLIELHGGTIWLESCPGAGSTFAFTLPISRAPSC